MQPKEHEKQDLLKPESKYHEKKENNLKDEVLHEKKEKKEKKDKKQVVIPLHKMISEHKKLIGLLKEVKDEIRDQSKELKKYEKQQNKK